MLFGVAIALSTYKRDVACPDVHYTFELNGNIVEGDGARAGEEIKNSNTHRPRFILRWIPEAELNPN
jgi:hypothetical protein